MYKVCRHIRTGGGRCRSAALLNQNFCHYHAIQRKTSETASLEFPPLDDRFAVQVAVGRILAALASGAIDRQDARMFLYGIQIAASNLPRETGVLAPWGTERRVVLTPQNEQVAVAETIFEEEDLATIKNHKKNCECADCTYDETDDPHHFNCACGDCATFAPAQNVKEEKSESAAAEAPAGDSLQQRVQAALQQGWQPQGGVSIAIAATPQGEGQLFAQAMIR